MKNDSAALKGALCELLEEKLPAAQVQSLKDEGFKVKKPTRKAALAIAIYKKAASGDLSAVKELRSILSGDTGNTAAGKAVIILDDTAD
ncbi:MAG: hypothetical protein IKZ47_01170 [Clostridia bacterium]|nr:hypothetical protein [Clostridia bacterium]